MVNTTIHLINTALICLILYQLNKLKETPGLNTEKIEIPKKVAHEKVVSIGIQSYSSNDIIHIYSKHGGAQVVTKHEEIFTWESLSKLQNRLPENFIRCHRSHIVNRNEVENISDTEIQLIDGNKIPIGKTYQSNITRANDKTVKENIKNK